MHKPAEPQFLLILILKDLNLVSEDGPKMQVTILIGRETAVVHHQLELGQILEIAVLGICTLKLRHQELMETLQILKALVLI